MRLQDSHGVVANPAFWQSCRMRNLIHEIFDEIGDIFAPLGQRRNPNRHHGQTMIQVFPEFAFDDQGFKISCGRRHDPYIDGDLGAAANALKRLVDEHTQDLVLRLPRKVGDIVNKQRAAMGVFERAGFASFRPIGLVDAEQFDFHPLRRNCGGIYDNKRSVRPSRKLVKGARGEFLAGTRWADDKHAAIGRRYAFDRSGATGPLRLIGRRAWTAPAPVA